MKKDALWPRLQRTCLLLSVLGSMLLAGKAQSQPPLRVYFIDVEGGQSTLFVTGEGQSLLVDTGWDDHDGRDANRIVAAAKKAGLTRIDTVLITHYHQDHVGGLAQLADRFPIATLVDHGENRELDHGRVESDYSIYQHLLAAKKFRHVVAHPGDTIPLGQTKVEVISSDGSLIGKPLPGAGQPNPFCNVSTPRPADMTENARSLGVLIDVNGWKILDLGDLTWDKEMELMCPSNRIGQIDVLVVSHHGWSQSSSPALVEALHARVAVMDNGETKGGSTPTFQTLSQAPGLEALWQLHYSQEAGPLNRDAQYIANLRAADAGYGIDLTLRADGSFDLVNDRTGLSKRYAPAH